MSLLSSNTASSSAGATWRALTLISCDSGQFTSLLKFEIVPRYLFLPVNYPEDVALVDYGYISSLEPSIGRYRLFRGSIVFPIPEAHVWRANEHLARFINSALFPAVVYKLALGIWNKLPNIPVESRLYLQNRAAGDFCHAPTLLDIYFEVP